MLRETCETAIAGGPSLSPSAITLRTGVSWVTERMPMSANTRANNSSAAIAMYLISDIFSLHDLRGPSAYRDACYRSRPLPRSAPDLPSERFRRGHGNFLLSGERRAVAR